MAIPLLLAPAPSAANDRDHAGDRFRGLDPGQFVVREQVVPVRLVFIGYQRSQIDEAALRSWLPQTYVPLVRYPQFYGLSGRDVGLKFSFSYHFVYKNRRFNDDFFEFLEQKGTPGDPTPFQQLYNDQAKNLLDVTGPVLYIDAPSVEKFLAGCDSDDQPGYTIYFVNWYGRRDFKFHVYTKTDEPDPDTGYNFGEIRGLAQDDRLGGQLQPELVLRSFRRAGILDEQLGGGRRGRAGERVSAASDLGIRPERLRRRAQPR